MTGATDETNPAQRPRRLGAPEVSRRLGTSYWSIYARIANGTIRATKTNREYEIEEDQLPAIAALVGVPVPAPEALVAPAAPAVADDPRSQK